MGEAGFCKNLQVPAVSYENLRFAAVSCENLRLRNPLISSVSRKSTESATIGSDFFPLASPSKRSLPHDPVQGVSSLRWSQNTAESAQNACFTAGETVQIVKTMAPSCGSKIL